MGLIKETNAAYYSGQIIQQATSDNQQFFEFGNTATGVGFNTNLVSAFDSAGLQIGSNSNFNIINVTTNSIIPENTIHVANVSNNSVILQAPNNITNGDFILCQLKESAIDQNYGQYSYISLNDIVDNFIVGYTGEDQTLDKVKRSQILFHAKRSLQELSYDTLPSLKSQELTIPPSLSIPLPQDYVNYIKVSWCDASGVLHNINPLMGLSGNPTELPIQDGDGVPTQNYFAENNEAQQSLIEDKWKRDNTQNITGNYNPYDSTGVYNYVWWKQNFGQRYGLSPEYSNINGWFSINDRTGSISFSSDLAGKLIMFKYISDGLAYNKDSKIPKLAEEAMYMSIMYNVIAPRRDVDPGTKAFYKREKYVKTRNAKIRMQNLKIDDIVQVFRGQSKWIKH